MRTSWIVLATAALGCLTGLGLTYYEAVTVEDRFDANFVDDDPDSAEAVASITGRAVVVGESVFDFGTLEKDQSGTCTFTVRNESVAPLMVALEGVSCGLCIQTDFSNATVEGGKEFSFDVNYSTHKDGPEFSEYVEMKTSDPKHRVIRFNITGYVTKMTRLSKSEIALGSVSAGEDVSTDFRIYGFSDDPVQIEHHEYSGSLASDHFTLELTPLEPAAYQEDAPRATSAVLAELSMKRGMPLGPIRQTLHLTMKLGEKSAEAELSIRGTVVSDIMLIGGSDFNSKNNLVTIGPIPRGAGHSTTLRIRVRGPQRDEVKLSVGDIDPSDGLTATIGEPQVLQSGYLYPLSITIPKEAPVTNRLGSQQSKVGVINIETTHPSAKQVPVYVSFAVD